MRVSAVFAVGVVLLGCVPTRVVQAFDGAAGSGAYWLEVVDEWGNPLPTFERAGRTYVLGVLGQRYLLHVRNRSAQRIEVLGSVDGRDVVDGRPAGWNKRGYIVDPYGDLTIDGYRLNEESVAAFRFSSVPQSYAARMGNARDVGIIGVAVFPERQPIYHFPSPSYRQDGSRAAPTSPSEGDEAPSGDSGAGFQSGVSAKEAAPSPRAGLGTEFAEQHASHVRSVHFERASTTPAAVLNLRYDDRQGLLALGIDVDGIGWHSSRDTLRETAEPFRRNTSSFAQPPPGWRP